MYRLLIVDDEQMIVDWLYRLFGSLNHMELDIYKACSGFEAVNLLNQMKIDIVLTDIRMPEMSGLQLLENIKTRWPQCKVIFLTGYNEFEYVYTAIKHEGVSYLLKTEDDSEIIKTVQNAIGEIEKSFRNSELVDIARQKLSMAMPLLHREYLLELLSGEEAALQVSQQQLDELGIQLKADQPVILLLGRLDNLSKKLSRLEKTRLVYTVKTTIEQYLLCEYASTCLMYEDVYMVWFIQPLPLEEVSRDNSWKLAGLHIVENLEAVQKVCLENLNSVLSFAASSEPVEWNAVSDKLFLLKQLMNNCLRFDTGIILKDKNQSPQKLTEEDCTSCVKGFNSINGNKTGTLQNYLDMGKKKDFDELFNDLTFELKKIKSMYSIMAAEMYYSLSLMFLSYINRCNIMDKLAFKTGLYKLTRIEEFDSWDEAVQYLQKVAEAIFEIQDTAQEQRSRDTVSLVRQYIIEHLSEDISLVKLSELVYFNPSYLSRLFKQATGMNITDYIHSIRISKAKELLGRNDMKIHEITTVLGYESPAYFAKFFKKATNMTPQEYRDTLLKK